MILTAYARAIQKDVCAGEVRHELSLFSVANAINVRHTKDNFRSIALSCLRTTPPQSVRELWLNLVLRIHFFPLNADPLLDVTHFAFLNVPWLAVFAAYA
jgi:hypothetical protein